MTLRASFAQLGLLAFTHWLLTGALGTLLLLVALVLNGDLQPAAAVDWAWVAALLTAYLTWPYLPAWLLASLWVGAAGQPRQRAARLLLALVLCGGAWAATLALLLTPRAVLTLAWPWLLASFVAAGWLYRPWLRATG